LKEKSTFEKIFYISEMTTERTPLLHKSGVLPLLLLCAESPNVDWKFYHEFINSTKWFKYAMCYNGIRERCANGTQFLPMYWPNRLKPLPANISFRDKKFLVMIASNKSQNEIDRTRSWQRLRQFKKNIYWRYLKLTDPLFRFTDLYQKRIEAINYFSAVNGFDLYGTQWNETDKLDAKTRKSIQRLSPRMVDDKLSIMSQYKFSLCFENCIFPGYLTEKIFDCFMAGCIPVYLGAPDIEEYVPSDVFIDYRQFKNYHELEKYLTVMTESEIEKYLRAAKLFLESTRIKKFTDHHLAMEIMDTIKKELR
jgi:hypothetical protein